MGDVTGRIIHFLCGLVRDPHYPKSISGLRLFLFCFINIDVGRSTLNSSRIFICSCFSFQTSWRSNHRDMELLRIHSCMWVPKSFTPPFISRIEFGSPEILYVKCSFMWATGLPPYDSGTIKIYWSEMGRQI